MFEESSGDGTVEVGSDIAEEGLSDDHGGGDAVGGGVLDVAGETSAGFGVDPVGEEGAGECKNVAHLVEGGVKVILEEGPVGSAGNIVVIEVDTAGNGSAGGDVESAGGGVGNEVLGGLVGSGDEEDDVFTLESGGRDGDATFSIGTEDDVGSETLDVEGGLPVVAGGREKLVEDVIHLGGGAAGECGGNEFESDG